MNAIGLVLLVALAGSLGLLLWRRHCRQRLPITHHRLRCPIHGERADVTVATDPEAPSGRQYVDVVACSLRPRVAVRLPERVGYLGDGPLCKVRLESTSEAVYADASPCCQDCVFVLNATAGSGPPPPLDRTSGTSDAIALAAQVVGNPRIARLLWYTTV